MPSLTTAPRFQVVRPAGRWLALALLLLVVVFGVPALAQEQQVAGQHAACTTEQQAMVEEAREVARLRTKLATRLVVTEPDHPHIQRWFGNAPRAEIADRLKRSATQLGRPDSMKVLCNDLGACDGGHLAFARPGLGIIGLCAGFFQATMKGLDTRWGILLHEATHLAAETDDFAYGPTAALTMAKTNPAQAARNADNYEYFVETLPW